MKNKIKKIIIITGASRGLGKAIADFALNDKDALIFSVSRSIHEDHKHIDKDKFILIKTDLSENFSNDIIETINDYITSDSILYFFNNASIILPIKKIGTFNEEEIENSIKINIQFPVKIINSLLKNFTKNKIVLINISSGAGVNSVDHWSLYGSSKAYMNLFFKNLEEENISSKKIKAYTIDPGVIDTDMQNNIRSSSFPKQDYFISLKTDNRLNKPADVALKIFNHINY